MKYLKYINKWLLIITISLMAQLIIAQPNGGSIESDKLDQVVGEFTGAVNLTLPLGSVSNGSLSAGLTLSYAANGMRPQEMSSPVGLGWALSSGYGIHREVQGRPDAMSSYSQDQNASDGDIVNGEKDGEFDLYRLTLPGFSGEFVQANYDINVFKTLETSEIKINYNSSNENFIVLLNDGTQVTLIPGGWIYQLLQIPGQGGNIPVLVLNSWVPSNIVSYDKKDTIHFIYNTNQVTYSYNSINNKLVEGKVITLSQIKGINDYLQIDWITRSDITANSAFRIARINYWSDTFCTKYDIDTDYFTNGSTSTQIRLKSIQKKSCDNTETEPLTSFEYYGTTNMNNTQFAPLKSVTGIDHWGYYNGANSNSASNLLPSPGGTANRNISFTHTLESQLKSVTTPLGKKTEYEYELNTYNSISSEQITVGPAAVCNPPVSGCYHTNSLNPILINSQDMLAGNIGITLDQVGSNGGTVTVSINSSNGNNGSISFNAYYGGNTYTIPVANIQNQNNQPLFIINQTYYISIYVQDGTGSVWYSYHNTTNNAINGPGLRVKKIREIHHENPLESLHDITDYSYGKGKLLTPPNTGVNYSNKWYNIIGDVNALNILAGVNIGYDSVKISKPGLGHTVSRYDIDFPYIETGGVRTVTDLYKGGFGNLLSTTVYNSAGQKITKDSFEYIYSSTFDITQLNGINKRGYLGCNSSNVCNQNIIKRYRYTNYINRIKKKISFYGDVVTSTTYYDYLHGYTLQPRLVTTISGNGYNIDLYTEYTLNLWSNNDIKNKFISDGINLPFSSVRYENGVLAEGSRTDYAYYSQSGAFIGANNGGNTTHIIRPFAQFRTRKDVSPTGFEYQDYSYHQYTPDGLIMIDQKVNWPSTTYTFNRKRLTQKNYNSGYIELIAYKGNSNLIDKITQVDGRFKTYNYDKLFRVISVTESSSNITTNYTYDLSARMTTESTNYGVYTITNRRIHDKAGRLYAFQESGVTPNNYRSTVTEYDKYGRKVKEFLPFLSSFSSGTIVAVPGTQKFTETKYESSPLSRVTEVIPPEWYGTKYVYGLNNSTDNVAGYSANQLFKETVIDSNGNTNITFKNFMGWVILQRQSNIADLAPTRKDTYTHYDGFGRITKVIPPGATTTTTPELIYEYTYTVFDQVSTKKIPGKGLINYTYNSKRLLAGEKSSTMTNYIGYKYDAMGRLTQTGLSTATISTPDNPTINTLYTETVFGTTTFLKDKVVTEKTNILGTANMLQTNYAYDTRGRIEQKTYNSHKNLTLNNTVIYTYDNASNLLSASNTINNGSAFTYSQSYTYDHRGRLIDENFTHNSVTKKLSTHEYNFRDELIRLRQGHHTGTTYLQDIDYTYRNNGMLQSMNSPMASNATTGDLFYYELYYDNPIDSSGSSAQKNGNIANQRWQRRGATMGMYAYTYDIYNQLTNADYWDYTTSNSLGASTTKYDQSFSYDVRGNLLTQTRRNEVGTQTDNLSYTLLSNQNRLARVHDLAVNALGHNNNGNANSGNIYTYDANGNLISDNYRGVSSIVYNHLDLPTLVQRSSTNKLVMIYDATGNLLCRKTYTTSSTIANDSIDFIGNIEYVNNVIDQVHHEQGRYKSISAGVFRHEYTIADHLGNTRIVYADVNSNGTVEQSEILDENHYYAYGMELPGTFISGSDYRYKFNGIERVESFGMDFAFYRGLDPILGRWYGVDPEAEMYANMSPYCAMNNNPGNEVDPLGDSPVHVGAALIGAGINMYNNWSSIVRNPWSAIGYAGTGALAGFVSVNGGAAAAAKITAIGNLATDAMTGNAPDIKSVNDAFNYGAKTVGNALDVGGSGKLANAGINGLKKLGLDLMPDIASQLVPAATGQVADEIVTAGLEVSGFAHKIPFDVTISASRGYAGQMAIGSLLSNPVRNAVGGQLGASANGGLAPKHGGTGHNDRIDQWVKKLKNNNGVQNIRKNQQQVDINGKIVGKNRPDLQFDYNGKHHNLEWDTKTASSIKHKKVVTGNDPKAISKFWKLLK